MKAILIIGMTGTGKTTETKKLIASLKNRRVYIYDINNEYKNFGTCYHSGMDEFLNKVSDVKNSVVIFEEATIFFSARGRSQKLMELLVKKRHNNNVIVFNFHALRFVPNDILALIDFIYLKKTNDNTGYVHDKFKDYPCIIEGYMKSLKSNNRYDTEVFKNVV